MKAYYLLKNIPLFSILKDEELKAMSELTISRRFSKDGLVLLAEEEGDTMFIIVKGKVKVTSLSEEGREVIFSILKDGDFFGEMTLFDGKPRSATVIAAEETELLLLRRADFIDLLERNPQMAVKMLAELAGRLRKADKQIEGLALLDVHGRVVRTLLQLAQEQGVPVKRGVQISRRPTHQDLANMCGTTRETVSRILGELQRGGYLLLNGRTVTILDERRLRDDFSR